MYVLQYLVALLPACWIGRIVPVEVPPRCPDATPRYFFLWGYLKLKVCKNSPQNLNELEKRIQEEAAAISPRKVKNSFQAFFDRLGQCLAVNGEYFEHLLR